MHTLLKILSFYQVILNIDNAKAKISSKVEILTVDLPQKTKSTHTIKCRVDLLIILSGSEQSRTAVQIGY